MYLGQYFQYTQNWLNLHCQIPCQLRKNRTLDKRPRFLACDCARYHHWQSCPINRTKTRERALNLIASEIIIHDIFTVSEIKIRDTIIARKIIIFNTTQKIAFNIFYFFLSSFNYVIINIVCINTYKIQNSTIFVTDPEND